MCPLVYNSEDSLFHAQHPIIKLSIPWRRKESITKNNFFSWKLFHRIIFKAPTKRMKQKYRMSWASLVKNLYNDLRDKGIHNNIMVVWTCNILCNVVQWYLREFRKSLSLTELNNNFILLNKSYFFQKGNWSMGSLYFCLLLPDRYII